MKSESQSESESSVEECQQNIIEKQIGEQECIESFFSLNENNLNVFQSLGKSFSSSNKS